MLVGFWATSSTTTEPSTYKHQVDVIYGRNITGENANWITLGTTIRFPVPGGKPDHHRTGHL